MKTGRVVVVLCTVVSLLLTAFVATGGTAERRRKDKRPPRIVKATMLDTDGNFFVDGVVLKYSEKVRHRKDTDGSYPFTIGEYEIEKVSKAKGRKITVTLAEAAPGLPDTLAIPNVKYTRTKKGAVRDRAGNQAKGQTFKKTRPASDAFVLTVNRSGDGTIRSLPLPSIDCGDVCKAAFPAGMPVELTADQLDFAGWGGDCAGAQGPICTVTMDSDKTVDATFGSGSGGLFKLTVIKAGAGDGTVTSLPAGIDCGTSCEASFDGPVTLTALPALGSKFSGWGGACASFGVLLECVLNLTNNTEVTAAFDPLA